ncbi:class I SAM-dependent methyltransferase [Thermococcus barophilus]|uniref:Methyltransferase type 11 domain-containing protein n=1 Tax=Thermococcus barophilus TaxID=55802 RepID=A0A0S1XEB0_THEBA|nr:methyltransferase domain-containing protein [Thermococcus barophilus]ALM76149.1 hypothetical protein TBCH5v1_2252 [Thermococcus barophilus]
MKLDIGCGENKHKGYIGIDKRNLPTVDYIIDLDKQPLPFPDDSVEEVLLYNVLEHLESPWKVMREVIRVCKNGATIKVRVPYPYHPNAFRDPEHKYLIPPHWFNLFKELKIVEVELHYPSPMLGRVFRLVMPHKISELQPDEYRITLRVKK